MWAMICTSGKIHFRSCEPSMDYRIIWAQKAIAVYLVVLWVVVHLVLPKSLAMKLEGSLLRVEGFSSDLSKAVGDLLSDEFEREYSFILKAERGEQGWILRSAAAMGLRNAKDADIRKNRHLSYRPR